MTLVPVLLDVRPSYLGHDVDGGSLLLLPTAADLLLHEVMERVRRVSAQPPVVLTTFEPDDAYIRQVGRLCGRVESVQRVDAFASVLHRFAASDVLLFVSPVCYPADGVDLRALASADAHDARMVRHLVAFEAPSQHTKELVQTDADGRVHRIQRYFEPVTWPFPSGVLASMVPVACAQVAMPLMLTSLEALRMQLASSGVPSQDVPYHGDCFDLQDEAGALALADRRITAFATHEPTSERARGDIALVSDLATIHPDARLVGPVLVAAGAEVGAGALVIGPALIGEGARVEADAVVAQCLVLPQAVVARGTTVRHHVVSGEQQHASAHGRQRRNAQPHLVAAPEPARRGALPTYVSIRALLEPLLALLALVLLSPILLVMAMLVKFTSRGPIFYGDTREGKDARAFTCWKFRSMLTNASEMQRQLAGQQQMDGPQFKMDHDPRVTTVGYWLRRLNVDELPQLWNVVRGEMSFVGPRPSPFRENQICVPWRNGRLSVRPGITGLWQVCRKDRATGDFHQWIHYDLIYVRNVSFRLDLMIAAATILTLGGRTPVPLALMLGRKARPRARRIDGTSAAAYRLRQAEQLTGSALR